MVLGLIVPCYNEEETLEETSRQLKVLLSQMIENKDIDSQSFICFVDDGSVDTSWQIIEKLKEKNVLFRGIKLSRNFGHQNALIAGLMQMKDEAHALISLDADLQDDISLIPQFIEKYKEGYEIVYGVRRDRQSDSLGKRKTANFFYKFQHFMGIESIEHHADYRLLSQKSLHTLANFEEVHLFLRGIVPMLGFRSCSLFYKRKKRFLGKSKYPLRKMIGFALDGITSFSIRPLRFITAIGFILFVFSILGIFWVFIEKFILGNTVQGWSSMMVSMYFIGGIQIMSLGIIGEYVGRNYQQSKGRPRYIIEEEI